MRRDFGKDFSVDQFIFFKLTQPVSLKQFELLQALIFEVH